MSLAWELHTIEGLGGARLKGVSYSQRRVERVGGHFGPTLLYVRANWCKSGLVSATGVALGRWVDVCLCGEVLGCR